MKKIDFLILFFIILIALVFRLYKIDIPLADFHSWRQADTASVARNFLQDGFNLLLPKYDDLSNIQSGLENPEGYRMVEFPLYNAIFAYLYKNFSFLSLEIWGRAVSIFFSILIITVIYYLLLKEKNRLSAFFGSLIYAVFPFFVFYSRTVLPETPALGFAMISILFLYFFQQTKKSKIKIIYYLVSLIFFSLSLLIKPTAIFFVFPLIYIFLRHYKERLFSNIFFYLYFLISITPLILWRTYIQNFPEGIPANVWLIKTVNTGSEMKEIFFKPAFFRWIFFERINNLILGGYLTIFLIIGMIAKTKNYFFYSFALSAFSYLFTFQGGNVQHDYYQTLILPFLGIFSGIGINVLFENRKVFNIFIVFLSTVIILGSSWFFSYYQLKNHYNYSFELIQQANLIKNFTKQDDKIVTDTTGDTTLLYLSERKGAPAVYKDPKELKKLGYQYITTSNQEQIEKLKKEKYQVIFESNILYIFKL